MPFLLPFNSTTTERDWIKVKPCWNWTRTPLTYKGVFLSGLIKMDSVLRGNNQDVSLNLSSFI